MRQGMTLKFIRMNAQRILKVLTVIGAAGGGVYVGTRSLFLLICTFSGHNFTEELYGGWSALIFAIAWSAVGAFHAIKDS